MELGVPPPPPPPSLAQTPLIQMTNSDKATKAFLFSNTQGCQQKRHHRCVQDISVVQMFCLLLLVLLLLFQNVLHFHCTFILSESFFSSKRRDVNVIATIKIRLRTTHFLRPLSKEIRKAFEYRSHAFETSQHHRVLYLFFLCKCKKECSQQTHYVHERREEECVLNDFYFLSRSLNWTSRWASGCCIVLDCSNIACSHSLLFVLFRRSFFVTSEMTRIPATYTRHDQLGIGQNLI